MPPIPGITDYQAFGIIVATFERNERTKTSLRDHTIMVDSSEVVLTVALQKQRHGGASRGALARRKDLQGIRDRGS